MNIPFIDLKAQQKRIRSDIDAAIAQVLDDGQYVMGKALKDFEAELAGFVGCSHALGVSSGTDALVIPLMAWDVGPGDAVFVPSFTYTATAEAILLTRASPVFVEVDPETYNIDLDDLRAKIDAVKAKGELTPKVILSVDLFGLPVDYNGINAIAKEEGLHVLSDAAQAFGGTYHNQRVGNLAECTATSFFPAKPLGCYGDGGAVFCNDADLAAKIHSVRTHGTGKHKYDIVRVGMNGRLDTIQAAILSVKLKIFEDELVEKNKLASAYSSAFKDLAQTPVIPEGYQSAWAQYTIQLETGMREGFQENMKSHGIPTMVYYPSPMHLQPPYAPYGDGEGSLPISESICAKVVALPMHPYMDDETRDFIIDKVTSFLGK